MSTAQTAWEAFLRTIAETNELHRRGASTSVIADLLRHARELLDIVDDEVALSSVTAAGVMRESVAQLRMRLESLEQDVIPTRHRRKPARRILGKPATAESEPKCQTAVMQEIFRSGTAT